ncbi:MAG: SHOCT domain-containing protein, partial [Pedobacter sp.]
TTLKLRKLKTLYDKHLITQEEYEAKKANILDSF